MVALQRDPEVRGEFVDDTAGYAAIIDHVALITTVAADGNGPKAFPTKSCPE